MRRWLYLQLDSKARGGGISPLNGVVVALILLSLGQQIVETEPLIRGPYGSALDWLERALHTIFAIEYGLRVWAAGEDPSYVGVRGRLRYMVTPFALLDLLAILPGLVSIGSLNLSFLRSLRILRVLRFANWDALKLVAAVLRNRLPELGVSLGLLLCLVILSATGMYLVEGQGQPETFGSIPRALWWSVITMTTVGYGDVTPLTPFGKLLGSLVALMGVAGVAIPTGIIAASFSEMMEAKRRGRDDGGTDSSGESTPPPAAPC